MTGTANCRYRSFLSYSHADTSWAEWLQDALERFPIDRDLIGRVTAIGPIPPTLRPIFRDRDDFAAGHSLNAQTITALDDAAALIVLCSPTAAKSHYVNEEIRLFKRRHPARPVVPVIVSGRPGGGANECFPPALRFKLDAQGAVSSSPEVALVAADARENGDGRERSLAKVVAALIGVPVDDVRKRHAIAEAHRLRVNSAIATGFAVVVLVAGFLYQYSARRDAYIEQNEKERTARDAQRDQALAETKDLVQKLLRQSLTSVTVGTESALGNAIQDAANAANRGDNRLLDALKLLKDGKTADAVRIFRAVAEEKGSAVQQDKKITAAAYRNLGAIAGLRDPKAAREAYANALEFDPNDTESLYWFGYLNLDSGNFDIAETSLKHLYQLSDAANDDFGRYRAQLRLADLASMRRDISLARASQEKALAIVEHALKVDPTSLRWRRELSVVHNKIGDFLTSQSQYSQALQEYKQGLAVIEQLLQEAPDKANLRYDAGISHERIGAVFAAQGKYDDALKAYKEKHAIVADLAQSDPAHVIWQRDLALSEEKIADIYVEMGQHTEALSLLRQSLAKYQKLIDADPANAEWRRDGAVSKSKIGDVFSAQRNFSDALVYYTQTLTEFENFARANPEILLIQRDLSEAQMNMGDAEAGLGQNAKALQYFQSAKSVRLKLSQRDPTSVDAQYDLAAVLLKLGTLQAGQNDTRDAAKETLHQGLEIMQALTIKAPDNAQWAKDLQSFQAKNSELR